MRYRIAVSFLLLAILFAAVALVSGRSDSAQAQPQVAAAKPHPTCDSRAVKLHNHRAHVLFKKAYADSYNLPDTDKIHKAQKHKLCVRISNVRDNLSDYRSERKQAWYEAVNPFVGGGQRWALPYPLVVCESGAGSGSSNLYGLLAGWNEWNYDLPGAPSSAGAAPKIYQDIAAHRGRDLYGGYWECNDDGSVG
jgi:hypothetical protein